MDKNVDKNLDDFLKHPLYVKTREAYEKKQKDQIVHGFWKYDEPLNPESWTFEQLHEHAFSEIVDLTHYQTAMLHKVEILLKQNEKMKNDVEHLKIANEELNRKLSLSSALCNALKKENERLMESTNQQMSLTVAAGTTYTEHEDFTIKQCVLNAIREGRGVNDGCYDAASFINRTPKACSLRWGHIRDEKEIEQAKRYYNFNRLF